MSDIPHPLVGFVESAVVLLAFPALLFGGMGVLCLAGVVVQTLLGGL
jgi:hypothetical protein